MSVTRILLVDEDSRLYRLAFARCLTNEAGVCVVETADRSANVVELASRHRPDVVLLGISRQGTREISAAIRLRRRLPNIRTVFLGEGVAESQIDEAIRAGAAGFIDKSKTLEYVIRAVRVIACGQNYYSTNVRDGSLNPLEGDQHTVQAEAPLSILSPREIEVLRHIALGRSAKEVARLLFISERTVNNHRTNLMKKIGIHDRVKLARYAIREGLSEL